MPREVRDRALALLRGEFEPPPLRDATTVVLLPDTGALTTYLMRRALTMAFAPGMWVFPGGRVDSADAELDVAGEVSATRLTAPSHQAATALVVSAVREVFEETSVLLAVDDHGRTPEEDSGWESDRAAVATGEQSFEEVLVRRQLHVDADALRLWTHWVTPEMESRRYDVRFFIARVPPGQRCREVSGEADIAEWSSPGAALAAYARGDMPMLPPTVATLADLAPLPDTATVWAAARDREVRPLMPKPRLLPDGTVTWDVIDVQDGSVVVAMASEPAGSEVEGAR